LKITDCVLDIDLVVSYPLHIDRPEPTWESARSDKKIPESLFLFYCRAKYFSLDEAPRFLKDPDGILFPYLKSLINGIRESLEQSEVLASRIQELHKDEYSALKERHRIPYDPKAIPETLRSFKYLLVELSSALDQFAEVVALLFHGHTKGLDVGRASFTTLKTLAAARPAAPGIIVAPVAGQFQKLLETLQSEAVATGSEAEWLDLFYLYRNKLAHLGNRMFSAVGLHDEESETYTFFPNYWPRLIEPKAKRPGEPKDPNEPTLKDSILQDFVHQDVVEYTRGLLERVNRLLGSGFDVLCETYGILESCEPHPDVIAAFKKHEKKYAFRRFEKH
jgi:hypothetical protein